MTKLDDFSRCIPERFRMNELNMYVHNDQGILGAVFCFYFMLHSTYCDLTRISLAGFTFPLADAFRNAPSHFRRQCQQLCHANATSISTVIRRGFLHLPVAFDNTFSIASSLESIKIQVIYSATVDNSPPLLESTRHNVRTNLELMQLLSDGGRQSPYVSNLPKHISSVALLFREIRAAIPVCALFGFDDIADVWRDPTG